MASSILEKSSTESAALGALEQMKNLGPTSAAWLHAAGIHTPCELERIGAIEAWHRVRETEAGAEASVILLYALEGALRDIHWAHLPPTVKRELKNSAR